MRTKKVAHERADEGLKTKWALSTSPSLTLALTLTCTRAPTLTLTSYPHPQLSSCASFGIPKKDSSTVDNHFESDLSSYEIFPRVSIFETKWFGTAPFFSSEELIPVPLLVASLYKLE
jgi:hypothetical protein